MDAGRRRRRLTARRLLILLFLPTVRRRAREKIDLMNDRVHIWIRD